MTSIFFEDNLKKRVAIMADLKLVTRVMLLMFVVTIIGLMGGCTNKPGSKPLPGMLGSSENPAPGAPGKVVMPPRLVHRLL